MPCHSAMTTDVLTAKPDQTVEEVLAQLQKSKADVVPILNDEGKLEGVFSLPILMKHVLPVSVPMVGGGQMDVSMVAAPGIAKRLRKVDSLPVSELMERKVAVVNPDTPTWEGIQFIMEQNGPLMVIEKNTDKFLGVMDYHSAIAEIQRLKDQD